MSRSRLRDFRYSIFSEPSSTRAPLPPISSRDRYADGMLWWMPRWLYVRLYGAPSLFGSARHLLPIWPSYSQSPILTLFRWSPLITNALIKTRDLIHPDIAPASYLGSRFPSRLSFLSGLGHFRSSEQEEIQQEEEKKPLKGLLALHIRRGDYEEHCRNLAGWGSRYQGLSVCLPHHIQYIRDKVKTKLN